MSHKKTPKEIYQLKGKLKAKKRAEARTLRYVKMRTKTEREYQEKLAKDIARNIGD